MTKRTVRKTVKPVARKSKLVPLVVTTSGNAVFFGYGNPKYENEKRLEKARMCYYWSSSTRGVLGLSVSGPQSGSKVTLAAPAIEITNVTAVMECTPEAAAAWEKAVWG